MILFKIAEERKSKSDDFNPAMGSLLLGTGGAYSAYHAGKKHVQASELTKKKEVNQSVKDFLSRLPEFTDKNIEEELKRNNTSVNKAIKAIKSSRNKYALGALGALGGVVGLNHLMKDKKTDGETALGSYMNNYLLGGAAGVGGALTGGASAYNMLKGNHGKAMGYAAAAIPFAFTAGALNHKSKKVLNDNKDEIREYVKKNS